MISRAGFYSKLLFVVFALWLSMTSLLSYTAEAQNGSPDAGVGIRPALIEESLEPGASERYTVTLENSSGSDQRYFLFTRNISGVKSGGVPVFARSDREITGFELADWITLDQTVIDIPARQSATVSFTLDVPSEASPGSHFGGVFVSVDPPEIERSGAAVAYQVANIISIRVAGEATERADIRQFSTGSFVYSERDVDFQVRIENSGNVLVRPIGPLEIKNMFGQQAATLTFNDSQAGIFPNSDRQFNIDWVEEGTGFGRYEALLSVVYGSEGSKKTISSTVTFWILPMNIIGPSALALIAVLAITYFVIKLYIRRTVAQLTPDRRLIRRKKKSNSSTFFILLISLLTVTAFFLLILLVLFA